MDDIQGGPRRWVELMLILMVSLLLMGQRCSPCKDGRELVVRDDGTLACRFPPEPTTTTTTTSTTTTTTLAPPTTTTTTLPPTQGCALPRMPECGGPESGRGVYGCCFSDHHQPLPASPFDEVLDRVQDEEEAAGTVPRDRDGRVDEALYTAELVRRLRARGLCATVGGPGDEVGIKASNSESYQYDVHFSNGRPRRSGYVAYCSPARW